MVRHAHTVVAGRDVRPAAVHTMLDLLVRLSGAISILPQAVPEKEGS